MITAQVLKEWLNTIADDVYVAIDEGGMILQEVIPDEGISAAYIEVGGIPDDDELEAVFEGMRREVPDARIE